jgi:hypothetical protein
MAKKAIVELIGSLSLNEGGRLWQKNKPQLLTSGVEIAQYENRSDFRVKWQAEKAKKSKFTPKPRTASPPPPPPEPEPEEIDDDEVEDDEDEVDAGDESDDEVEDDEDGEDEDEREIFTRSKLTQKRKSELVEIGLEWGLAFDGSETAKTMIADILLAQER